MKTVFVFAYYSYKDPVFQSAVLPYLKMLSPQIRFILLTWEQQQFKLTAQESSEIHNQLKNDNNIIWHTTTWHSGEFKIIKKIYDFGVGFIKGIKLIQQYKATKIYSEGFPGAIISHYISKITRKPHIIHTFEPHADYMVDAGVWKKESWEYRLIKKLEMPIANHAETIITATSAYKKILQDNGAHCHIEVIPSCIDTTFYSFRPDERTRIRIEQGIKDDQLVIVYLGKIGGMYMDDEMFAFFKQCYQWYAEKFIFFILTNEPRDNVLAKISAAGIPQNKVLIKYLPKDEVPSYLSAADIGFCGIRPIPSRAYSSPIKNGEYWASGLFTLIPEGISNDWLLVKQTSLGVSFTNIDQLIHSLPHNIDTEKRKEIMTQLGTTRSLMKFKDIFHQLLT